MDPVDLEVKLRDEESATIPSPPTPGPIPDVLLEPTRPARPAPTVVSTVAVEGADPESQTAKKIEPTTVLVTPDMAVLSVPPAEPGKAARVPLTELQMARIQMSQWRYRAMKTKTALAQKVAEDAAMAEEQAYGDMMAFYQDCGIDTARAFNVDAKGNVTYPIQKAKAPPGAPPRPDYAPPEGKAVKR